MFLFALLLGIYSYIIFFLGFSGWLYKEVIIGITLLFWGVVLVWGIRRIRGFEGIRIPNNKLLVLFGFLLLLQVGVNLIGALGPELGFDALWYHLTLPKLHIENHSVFFPGGLLYYSAMPKLAEMLYIAGLSFGNEILVKCIHFCFSLLTCLALYKLSRKFFNPLISLITVVIFYSNLVVAWESITAYIDLVRAFFEVIALWAFVNWWETQKRKWLVYSAIMVGLAITTKLLAIGSLIIFISLILFRNGKRLLRFACNDIKDVAVFILIALTVPLPWFVFSYVNTGNPVYPFFTEMYKVVAEPLSLIGFFREVWLLFTRAADPIAPVYMMLLPLIIWILWRTKSKRGIRIIGIYSLLAIIVWYFTPRTGGGRFILPYLPAFSLLCAGVLSQILKNLRIRYLGNFLLVIIVLVSVGSIGYRLVANIKYLPVVMGMQTKEEFLSKNLNFSFGDFYDTDGYFKKTILPTDMVLLYGFHNLYYVDFPFIHASWKKPEDKFTYIATQNEDIPKEFSTWMLIYENEQTMVKLYKVPERLYTHK